MHRFRHGTALRRDGPLDERVSYLKRGQVPPLDSPLQSAAAHSFHSHVCGLRGIFCHAHVATKNRIITGDTDGGMMRRDGPVDERVSYLKRGQVPPLDSPLQSAAAHSFHSHVCGLRGIFCHAHVATKNRIITGDTDGGMMRRDGPVDERVSYLKRGQVPEKDRKKSGRRKYVNDD